MAARPSDSMQPAGKRRPGEQLTRDNAEDDEDGPAIDPGTWGKADQATLARRKVVRARRGAGAAEPAPSAAASEAAGSNPFAGVSLTAAAPFAANPFAGVSLTAAAKAAEPAKDVAASAGKDESGAAKPAEPQPAAAKTAGEETAAASPADDKTAEKTAAAQPAEAAAAAEGSKEPAAADKQTDKAADADKPAADAAKSDAAETAADKPAASTSLFGGSSSGFGALGSSGGFGNLSSGTGFGGGFGGFAAAAKDGSSGGSLFGSYTAPQPGSLFAPVPAFGAARQSKDGEEGADDKEEGGEGGEGDAVFGGNDNIAPVVQLSEVPKQTGEEQEDVLFAADGSLFEFVNGKEWRERGKGELRVNVHKATNQARLVMRQRGSQKLLLNANLYPKMTTSKMVGGKGVTFAIINAAAAVAPGAGEEKEKCKEGDAVESGSQGAKEGAAAAASVMRTYALKVKSAEKIDAFVAIVDSYKLGMPDGKAAAAGDGGSPTGDAAV